MARRSTRRRQRRVVEVPEDWRTRTTVTVQEYAAIMGIGYDLAYAAVHAGQVASVQLGTRYRVCVAPLVRQLDGGGDAR